MAQDLAAVRAFDPVDALWSGHLRLFLDGDQWCCLLGENLQEGIAGFGATPLLALDVFTRAWMARNGKGVAR